MHPANRPGGLSEHRDQAPAPTSTYSAPRGGSVPAPLLPRGWDVALFGARYDAQLGVLRAFEMAEQAGVPPADLVDLAVTRLRYVADGVETTAREVAERNYPRGPGSLAEHAAVVTRLAEPRRDARLGDGGLGAVVHLVEAQSSGPGAGRGLTALLDDRT